MSATLLRMTRFSFLSIPVLLLATLLPRPAHAWGAVGHRLVAHLAADELAPGARAEVARLLRGEADPTLAGVANWADELRDNPVAGDPDLGKRSSRWHYVNLAEDDCDYRAIAHCPDGNCVIEAIRRQRDILADTRQSDAARAQALKFLVHFVGDAHQPLHAGYARDKGGNTVQLQVGGKGSNLHRLWDSELIASAGMNEPAYLRHLQRMPLQPAARAGANDPAAWAEASCQVVLRDGFYPPRPKLAPTYFTQWRPTAEAQLRIAGHRLAMLLNDALANDRPSKDAR